MLFAVIIFILSIILMMLIAYISLPVLKRLKFGQPIHELALESQKAKQGTPTMGGLMFAAVSSALTIIISAIYGFSTMTLVLIVFSLLALFIGFADDYKKIKRQHNLGLLWWQKVIAQIAIGFLFTLYCYLSPEVGSKIVIPFTSLEWDLGIWYLPIMTLAVMFIVNSANLLDGMDGLLTSTSSLSHPSRGRPSLCLCC